MTVTSLARNLAAATALTLLVPMAAQAAFITTPDLDPIFAQSTFGNDPIDIRFLSPQTIANSAFLDITTQAEMNALLALDPNPRPTVNMFYVDSIEACGGVINTAIIGCGQTGGNNAAVESGFSNMAALIAHELVHNLGLSHVTGTNTNLMNPSLGGNTTLTDTQVAAIRQSDLVQFDTLLDTFFINITPILVTASAPEPATLLLLGAGLLGVLGLRRRAGI